MNANILENLTVPKINLADKSKSIGQEQLFYFLKDLFPFYTRYLSLDWNKSLSHVNWDEMVKFNDREISLFYGSIKIAIKNKQTTIRIPAYRSALFNNSFLNLDLIASNLIRSFVFAEDADANIAALFTLGMTVNSEHSGSYCVEDLNSDKALQLMYLLLCSSAEFDEEFKKIDYKKIKNNVGEDNVEALQELILDYRIAFQAHFTQFKTALQNAIFALYKINNQNITDVAEVFEVLSLGIEEKKIIKCNNTASAEYSFTKYAVDLAAQIKTIKQVDVKLLDYYKCAVLAAVDCFGGELKSYIPQAQIAINDICNGAVNYTKFYAQINSTPTHLIKAYSFLNPNKSFVDLAQSFDVLKLMSGAVGTTNLSLHQVSGNVGYSPILASALALTLCMYADNNDSIKLTDLAVVADVVVSKYSQQTIISTILLDTLYIEREGVNSEEEKLYVIKLVSLIFDLMIKAAISGDLMDADDQLMLDQARTIRDGLFAEGNLFNIQEAFSATAGSVSFKQFIEKLRKILSLNTINRLKKSHHFSKKDDIRADSVLVDGVVFDSVANWETLIDLYCSTSTIDDFILNVDEDFYRKFGDCGDAYKVKHNGKEYLIFLQYLQARLPLKNNKSCFSYSAHLYSISAVGADKNEDIDAEVYKLAFKLANKINE